MTSNKYFVPLIRENLVLILAFAIPCEVLHNIFMAIQRIHIEHGLSAWQPKLGEFCTTLLLMIFYTMLVALRMPEMDKNVPPKNRQGFWHFTAHYSRPFMLENIRALAWCLLALVGGGVASAVLVVGFQFAGIFNAQELQNSPTLANPTMLLIAAVAVGPALFLYMRYFFVSFVVLVDPQYEAGNADALKRSSAIVKGLMLPLIAVLAVFFWLDVQRMHMREAWPFQSMPLQAAGIAILFELVAIYANILLFQIYRLKASKYGTHV